MGERMCVICHDKPGKSQCRQCHKLICDECSLKVANGVFCSRDCSAKFTSFKKDEAATAARSGGFVRGFIKLFKLIVTLVLLTIIGGAVYVYGAKEGWFGQDARSRVIEKQKEAEKKIDEVRGE